MKQHISKFRDDEHYALRKQLDKMHRLKLKWHTKAKELQAERDHALMLLEKLKDNR